MSGLGLSPLDAEVQATTCGTVTVEPPEPEFDPNAVSVVDCGFAPGTIQIGDQVSLNADVQNNNDVAASVTVEWQVAGESATETLIVDANGTQSFNANETIDSGGSFSVEAVIDSAFESVQ